MSPCQPKQTRVMQRIQNSSKHISTNVWFFIEIKFMFDQFWNRFPSPKLGSMLASISDHVGTTTTSERHQKRSTKKDANMSPAWTPAWPKRPPKTASWICAAVATWSRIRLVTALMPKKPSWTPCWHHVGPFLNRFWTAVGPDCPSSLNRLL